MPGGHDTHGKALTLHLRAERSRNGESGANNRRVLSVVCWRRKSLSSTKRPFPTPSRPSWVRLSTISFFDVFVFVFVFVFAIGPGIGDVF